MIVDAASYISPLSNTEDVSAIWKIGVSAGFTFR